MKKRTTKKEPIATELWLGCDGVAEVTRGRNHEDEWDRDSTSTSWSFGDLTFIKPQIWGRSESMLTDFPVKVGDEVFVVVAVYSTGDSFGHDAGANVEVLGIYKSCGKAKKAKLAADECKDSNLVVKTESGKNLELYCPWNGYFESLDYVEVLARTVK